MTIKVFTVAEMTAAEKAADAACNQRTNDPANHSGRPVLVEQPALVGRSAVLFGYNLRRSICPRKTHR